MPKERGGQYRSARARREEEEFRRYEYELSLLQRKHLKQMITEERSSRKGVVWEGTEWDLKTFTEVRGWKRERKVRHMKVHDETDNARHGRPPAPGDADGENKDDDDDEDDDDDYDDDDVSKGCRSCCYVPPRIHGTARHGTARHGTRFAHPRMLIPILIAHTHARLPKRDAQPPTTSDAPPTIGI